MGKDIKPNKNENDFLTLSYNRFYDIFEEVMDDNFWLKDSYYRFSIMKDIYSIYSELLHYEPIKHFIKIIKRKRPPMEAEIGSDLFKFIRNILLHFPYFKSWDEIWISKGIINWYKKNMFIDNFLKKYSGKNQIKYRFWEENRKIMACLTIKFPSEYTDDTKIYLKDILAEKDGTKFALVMMKRVLNSQIVSIGEKNSDINKNNGY